MIKKNPSSVQVALAALLVLGFAAPISAETPQERARALDPTRIQFEGEPVRMSLSEVVMLAFQKNLDVEIRLVEQQIAQDGISAAQGIYDPTLTGRAALEDTDTPTTTLRDGGTSRRFAGERQDTATRTQAGVSQLLPTGATLGAGFSADRVVINDGRAATNLSPYSQQRAFVSLRQPLLQNFGTLVTNQGIRIARRQEEIARALYRQEVIDQTAAVMAAYWNVVFSIRNLEVQRVSLESALELERVNAVRVDTGAAPRADLLQAQAQVAQRRNAVIAAKSAILTAQDELLRILNWNSGGENWNRPIEPVDQPTEYDLELMLDDSSLIADAVLLRPDFRAAELGIDIAEINRNVARRQRLPQLDLFAEYGFNGLGDDSQSAFQEVRENDYADWVVGLDFRYPLLNRRARAEYRQAENELRRSELLVQQAELRLITQVRSATRRVRTAQESIEASLAQVAAARETLEVERRRLDVGGSTTFNVLRLQQDLAEAEVAEVRALVDYKQSLIELERARGTLLEQLGTELNVQFDFDQELPERPQTAAQRRPRS